MGQYLSRTGVSEPSGSRHYRPTPTSAQIFQFGSDTPVRLRYSSSAQILRYSETPTSAQPRGHYGPTLSSAYAIHLTYITHYSLPPITLPPITLPPIPLT